MKIIAALFVAFLAIQTSTQSPLEADSTKTTIVDLINSIISVTDPILQEVKTKVAEFEADKDAGTDKIISRLSEIAAKLNALLIKGVDELKENANDDALVVLDCIDQQEDATNTAVTATLTDLAGCISVEYDAVFEVVDQVLTDLQDLEDDIQGQVQTLSDCTSADLTCIIAFGTTLLQTAENVVSVGSSDISSIIKVAKEVISQIDSCDLAPGIKTNAETILNNAAICIRS